MYHVRLNVNVADRYIPYQVRVRIPNPGHFLITDWICQDTETKQLLVDFLNSPDNFNLHLKRFTTSLASTIVYGWRTTSVDLPQVKLLFEVNTHFHQLYNSEF
jgi:hypothetical protein